MDQEKGTEQRRVKVTDATAHRSGTKRAAIKPHKRGTEPNIKQLISDYVGSLRAGSLSQTFTGTTITQNAAALRANFGLEATDEPYLLLDPTKTGRAGMLLSATGIHLADGRGNTATTTWKELPSCTVAYQRNMLVIGQGGVSSTDGKTLAPLLQQIQAKLAK